MLRSAEFMAAMDAYDSGNSSLALRLMQKCAESGDPVACYTMALWHGSDEGTEPSIEQQAHWLGRLAALAESGHIEAQWDLSARLRWGDLVPIDVERANCWLERAAAAGCGSAQHHLAWYHETGQFGYSVNDDAAAAWYRCAFAQNHPETLYLFAVRKFKDGMPTDEAIQLLRKAASMGLTQAVHVLAAVESR